MNTGRSLAGAILVSGAALTGCGGDGCVGETDVGTFVRSGVDVGDGADVPLRIRGTDPDEGRVNLDLKGGSPQQQDALWQLEVGDTADLGDDVQVRVLGICENGAWVETDGVVTQE